MQNRIRFYLAGAVGHFELFVVFFAVVELLLFAFVPLGYGAEVTDDAGVYFTSLTLFVFHKVIVLPLSLLRPFFVPV